MIRFVLLAAVITTASAQQAWIEQLREADRLRNENRYDEAERAYIVARKQAETLGADELPMAITLNRIGYQHQMLGRLREAERSYAAALATGRFANPSFDLFRDERCSGVRELSRPHRPS